MLIKGKGRAEVGLRYTRPEDILTVGFDGARRGGAEGLQPPSESYLHIWLYKMNPDVESVIHVHPESAVLLTICDKEIRPIYGAFGPGARMALDGVPVYPRSIRISDDTLGADFASFMAGRSYALMRGHGVSVTGASVEDALVRTMNLNELVSMNYKAHLLGDPQPISAEDQAEIASPTGDFRGRGSAGGRAGMLANYRYYRTLAGESA